MEIEPAALVPHAHAVLLLLGTSEGVAPECATSCRYIDQGAAEGYSAYAVDADSNVTRVNIERINNFFIFVFFLNTF
jgi:hypothetical protein